MTAETLLILAALLGSPQVPDTLNTVVLTAERNPAVTAAAPVLSVSAEAMARTGAAGLHEVLRTLPGVSIKDYGGAGGLKTVSIRGLGAQHTAVTYNGATVSDLQSGQVDLSRFNLDNLSGVRVEIGPADDIFRPARTTTSSGVLSMKTKDPDFSSGDTRLTAQMRYGSFATYNPYILLQQRLGSSWYAEGSLNWLVSENDYPFTLVNGDIVSHERRLGSDVHTLRSELRLGGELPRGGQLQAQAQILKSERGLPGPVILYTQEPTERLWDDDVTASVSYDRTAGRWKYRAALGYNYAYNRYLNNDAAYAVPEDDRYAQQEWSGTAIVQFRMNENLRLVLAEDLFAGTLEANTPECAFPFRHTSVTALSAQYKSHRLTVTAGLTETLAHESVREGTPAPDRHRLSPSVSSSLDIGGGLHVRVSYKDGFRIPTFNDLYYSRVGNTSLECEKARQTGLGFTWNGTVGKSSLALTADGYYNSVKDKIVAVPTMFIWKMRNVGRVNMLGADVSFSAIRQVADQVTLHLNAAWSYLYAVDVTDPSAKNYKHQIQYTPRHSGSVVASAETPWVTIGYTLYAVGARYFLPQNIEANRLDGYADHSLSVSRTFTVGRTGLNLSAEALNLGNVNYCVIHNYPMPGRNYRITLKIMI